MATEDNVKELIEQVVKESGKSTEEIKGMMEERKEATHGLLSDYGALYAVAKQFGISFQESKVKVNLAKLSEIAPQKPYSVVGRVKRILPIKEFERKDGSKGKLASVFLLDDSGECRLVLWDTSASLVNKLSRGDILMVRNAYGKESLKGGVELHAGSLTKLSVNPQGYDNLPEVKEELKKIKELKTNDRNVDVIGRISAYYPPTEFTREDGSTGVRASFILEDESGKIRAVLWGEPAKKELKRGDVVKIENGYTKEGLNHEAELHVGNLGKIALSKKKISLPELAEIPEGGEILKIKDIKADSSGFTSLARVLRIFLPRQYSKGQFASLIIGDSTGTIRAVLWDDKSKVTEKLKPGDALEIKNVYSKPNLTQEPEIHVGKFGEVTLNSETSLPSLEEIEKALTKEKKITDLQNNESFIKISGKVVDLANKRLLYFTCPKCNTKIQDLGMGWYCDACDEEVEPEPNLMVSFTVEDDTGSIRAVSFRAEAEKVLDMDLEEIMNLIGETQDETEPLARAKESLLNTQISLVGRVRYNNFSDQLEFMVSKVE